jgi:hypothetical protein
VAFLAKSNPAVLSMFLGSFSFLLIVGFITINIDYFTGHAYTLREPSEALWLCILAVSFLCAILVITL